MGHMLQHDTDKLLSLFRAGAQPSKALSLEPKLDVMQLHEESSQKGTRIRLNYVPLYELEYKLLVSTLKPL